MTTSDRKLIASKIADEFVSQLQKEGAVTSDSDGLRHIISQKLLTMAPAQAPRRLTMGRPKNPKIPTLLELAQEYFSTRNALALATSLATAAEDAFREGADKAGLSELPVHRAYGLVIAVAAEPPKRKHRRKASPVNFQQPILPVEAEPPTPSAEGYDSLLETAKPTEVLTDPEALQVRDNFDDLFDARGRWLKRELAKDEEKL